MITIMNVKQFSQEKFNEFIIKNNIIGFFEQPIKLKSGRLSNWYVNWRDVTKDAYLSDMLTDQVLSYVDELGIEPLSFYGVPEGATKLGVICQMKWARMQEDYGPGNYPLPMGRAKPKEHGAPKDKYFVGEPRGKTIVLEDVTTTGGSLLETVEMLQNYDVDVACAIGLTNRDELRDDGKSVEEKVNELGVQYFAMSHALKLLPQICESEKVSDEMKGTLRDYFDKYGTNKIEF